MPQQYKVEQLAKLKSYFNDSNDFVFNNFSGLTVDKMIKLRRELGKQNTKFVVSKNNFIRMMLKEKNLPDPKDSLFGPTAVAFSKGDASEVLKVLFKFSNEFGFKIKGGIVSGAFFDEKQLEALSKLPGKNQLLAQLLATMNAPMQNFVYACNDVVTRFLRVLNAVAETKK